MVLSCSTTLLLCILVVLGALSLPLYHQVLNQEISDFTLPDLAKVAEHSNPVEMGRLLQLVLGCAVKCERKQGLSAQT